MKEHLQFYIDGKWVEPLAPKTLDVINPATEAVDRPIAMGSADDVDAAVAAARAAFETLLAHDAGGARSRCSSASSASTRSASTSSPTSSPRRWARRCGWRRPRRPRPGSATSHQTLDVLADFEFEETAGHDADRARADRRLRLHHAVELADQPDRLQGRPGARRRLHDGAEAVARSRRSNAIIFAEILDEAGVPAGVFNLVNGDGATVGAALSSHPDVDMVSFTGSTRAGIEVAQDRGADGQARARRSSAASRPTSSSTTPTSRRPSPAACSSCAPTRGQSCNAPTRMLVPRGAHGRGRGDRGEGGRRGVVVGDPDDGGQRHRPGRLRGRSSTGSSSSSRRASPRARRSWSAAPAGRRASTTRLLRAARPCSPT